ncbi:hypothetical protein [Lysinibacillus sp. NPDC047702]|uniref:hypothetical protein n=1 Tax=unclassified Lysinibacillus TaxID=2636778 RepID=UPI003CFD2A20
MTLAELAAFLKTKPTFLDYKDELVLIKALPKLSTQSVHEQKELFLQVLDTLMDSHTFGGDYLEKEAKDQPYFDTCLAFLEKLDVPVVIEDLRL